MREPAAAAGNLGDRHLAHRLAARLRAGDPVATRVKLRKVDAVFSILASLRYLP